MSTAATLFTNAKTAFTAAWGALKGSGGKLYEAGKETAKGVGRSVKAADAYVVEAGGTVSIPATPAVRARFSTAVSSPASSGKSRWQWLSTNRMLTISPLPPRQSAGRWRSGPAGSPRP